MRIKEQSLLLKRIDFLKNEVEGVYGRKILSFTDCLGLSADIFRKTGHTLNTNTLRRFFGLVPYNFLPSQSTRDILSQYCGYASFDDVNESAEEGETTDSVKKDNVINFLAALFRIDSSESHNETFSKLVKETIVFLNRNAHLKKQFHQEVAKTKKGQEFYFEKFVDIDSLNSTYGEGLRIYLNEKKTEDGEIFANSLLTFRYWLTKDDAKLDKCFKSVMAQRLHKSLSPVIAARYFSTLLFATQAKALPTDAILVEADEFYNIVKASPDHWCAFSSFETIWAQALAITGHYGESLVYISRAFQKYGGLRGNKDEAFFQSLHLWKAFSLVHLDDAREAEKAIEKVRPESFYFLSKKFETIIYLSTLLRSRKSVNSNHTSQIRDLISETGFVRLNKFLRKESEVLENEQS